MRTSGILLPLFSLPSPYGIGTLGKAAYDFVDFLKSCKQYYWQILPINPTSYSNSPYQSTSAFAGNPYFIDLDMLCDMGLVDKESLHSQIPKQNERVDYAFLYSKRLALIKSAARRLILNQAELEKFKQDNYFWLEDYCFYMALKEKNNMRPLLKTKSEYLCVKDELKDEIDIHTKIQYLFFYQWKNLHEYANKNAVHIIGDLPIYVSADSSDFFSHRDLFYCGENGKPSLVAGCPPDSFSPKGQLWGNPLYDWQNKTDACLDWWKERFRQTCSLFDCVRIDHFRGLYEYYCIPANEKDAVHGKWLKGPQKEFTDMLKKEFPKLKIIAEDLGFITPDVRRFFRQSGYPGMKILQFAFDEENSEHLPHNHTALSVCYTGTHDNPTLLSWLCQSSTDTVNRALDYFGACKTTQLCHSLIAGAMSSVCDTAIIPIQDYMEIGCKGRINTPGTDVGNWEYRLPQNYADERLKRKILHYTKTYSRDIKEEIQ